ERVDRAPERLEPLRRDVQRRGKRRHAVGAEERRAEMRQEPQVLALAQGLVRLLADPRPVRRLFTVNRPCLPEQPVAVERREQFGVLEIVAARLFRRDGLEQRLLALPTSTHSTVSPSGPRRACPPALRDDAERTR